jgi:hypothetical protein
MVNAEFLYLAAANAGLLTPARIGSREVLVDFRAPDEEVLGGLGLSRNYTMRYPRTWWSDLASGAVLDIGGQSYRVLEIRQLPDASEVQASLTRL